MLMNAFHQTTFRILVENLFREENTGDAYA
jgi:hypothetical protein